MTAARGVRTSCLLYALGNVTCKNFARAPLLRSWKKHFPDERVHLRETSSRGRRKFPAQKEEMAHLAIHISDTLVPFFCKIVGGKEALFTSDRSVFDMLSEIYH